MTERETKLAIEELRAALFMVSSLMVELSKEVQRASRALQGLREKPADEGTTVTSPTLLEDP